MLHARITGTGSFLPSRVVTNDDLAQIMDTNDEWIRSRTGIGQRHIVESETTTHLAHQSALEALHNADVQPAELDLIIVATTTPDKIFPSIAVALQRTLGVSGCPAFDVQAVCSGFIYALNTAYQFIRAGSARKVLVVGAESFSKILNWDDRSTSVLFGDGAGAVILQRDSVPGILATEICADGLFEEMLHVPRVNKDVHDKVSMQGAEVFREAVHQMSRLADSTLAMAGVQCDELDWLVPHQANLRIINALAKKLNMSMDKVIVTIDRHANTSAASIPLALHEAITDRKIKRNDLVLMEAFGGGFTWGSALVRM